MGNHPFFILNGFMKIFFYSIIFFSIILCFLTSCSSSSKETQVTKQSVDTSYVFDKIPPENTFRIENPEPKNKMVYIVQIGAFSTLERAGDFAELSRSKLNKEIKVDYDETKKLYLVQVSQLFNNKNEAIVFRNELKNYSEFKDAWVVEIILNNQKK